MLPLKRILVVACRISLKKLGLVGSRSHSAGNQDSIRSALRFDRHSIAKRDFHQFTDFLLLNPYFRTRDDALAIHNQDAPFAPLGIRVQLLIFALLGPRR